MRATAIAILVLGWLTNLSPSVLQASAPDLSTLLTNDDAVSRRRELVSHIKSLRPEEIPEALKQAIAGHGVGRDEAINALSGRWVESDAPAALAFSRQTSDRAARSSIQTAYYDAWAKRDIADALKAANRASAGERAAAIWLIARHIGAREPQKAYELTKSVHTSCMEDIGYFIFWNWAKVNLSKAIQTVEEEAKRDNRVYNRRTAIQAITDRLFDDDPKAAANWASRLPPGKMRDLAFERVVSEWGKVDREAVAQWLKSWPDAKQAKEAMVNLPQETTESVALSAKGDSVFAGKADELDGILGENNFWLELEALLPFVDGLTPAEFRPALEHLRNIPKSNRKTVIDLLVSRWWEVDPAGAIRAIPVARTMHDGELSNRFLTAVYAGWAQRDPDAAFAAATADIPGFGNSDILRVLFATLARRNPAKTHDTFRKLNDANSHLLVIPIFTEWAAQGLPGATEALPNEKQWKGAIEGIVIGLMRKGPPAAIAWAESLPNQSFRDCARRCIALRWPDNPEAAAAWLEQSDDFEGKDRAFDDVAVDWAIRNPTESLHHALGLADGTEKERLLFWGMAQWTYDDAGAAQQFARKLADDKTRKSALTTVLIFWSQYDPMAAAEFLSSIRNEAMPNDVANIASRLSECDPAAAAQWLNAFPVSLDRAPAIRKIAENWHHSDAAAAGAWVNQLPKGSLYDAGALGLCTAWGRDLLPALERARSISDPKTRHDAVYQAFESATSFGIVDFGNPHTEIKARIHIAQELTESDKTTLLARIPEITIQMQVFPKVQ